MRPPPPPTWVPAVARRQAGLFTVAQALAAGMTVDQVRHRRRVGLWLPYAGAAMRHRDAPVDPRADAFAVALTWPDAVACLASAARFHRLPVPVDTPVAAWVPHARNPRRGMAPYQYALRAEDVVTRGPVRVTTPTRTVFDALGRLAAPAAESLLVWSLTRRVVEHAELAAILAAQPGLAGNARRRRLLALTASGAMSVAEARLHAILRRHRITGWATGQVIRDAAGIVGQVDVLFPGVRLVVEVDGLAYHGPDRFQADRARQNRLVAAGYTVLRFTWADLVERPDAVARQVAATLARLTSTDPTRFPGR